MVHGARAVATHDLAPLIITRAPGRAELSSGQSKTNPSSSHGHASGSSQPRGGRLAVVQPSGTPQGAGGCQGCVPSGSPVELEHAAGEGHAPWHLEGHPPDEVHLLAAVRVEGRVVQLLGVE